MYPSWFHSIYEFVSFRLYLQKQHKSIGQYLEFGMVLGLLILEKVYYEIFHLIKNMIEFEDPNKTLSGLESNGLSLAR